MSATIMIVDDSLMVRQQVSRALTDAGFGVVEASDGADGLRKLAVTPHTSLIVLDVNMPNMNGIEMLEKLRAADAHARIPVVMLTTEGQAQLMQKAKSLGAKGWIIKPFNPEMLVAAVHRLTDPS